MDQKTYEDIVYFLCDGTYPHTTSFTRKKKWNFRRKVSMSSVSESKKLCRPFNFIGLRKWINLVLMRNN